MRKSTVLQLGMMAVSICIVFLVVGSVSLLLDGNFLGALLGFLVPLPILMSFYVTFDHVRRQIEPPKDQVAKVTEKPWKSNPDQPIPEVAGTPWESNPDYTRDSS